jgi:putative hemolysin
MLYKVFDFADKEASDVMVPRPEVVALSIDLPPEQCLEAVMDSPFTRYPVYRESLDDVVGILHVRDLFRALRDRGMHEVKVEDIVRPAHIVPETKDLAALLTEFRRTNQHMAIVVDEYGDMEGIVTLEDLLEEIVGEIEDEFDLPDESVEQVDEDTVIIDGTFPIDDFNERFHSISHDGMRFDVLEVEGSRILKLAVTFEQRRDQRDRDDVEREALEAELFDAEN